MLPPVNPNVASMSTGVSTWRSSTVAVKPGAYSSTTSKQLSANAFFAASSQPPGRHLMSMFCQYAPYRRTGGWDDAAKNAFADSCFEVVEEYAPGFTATVLDRQVLTPVDIEATFGLTGGNIFQGAMSLNKLFMFRPAPGYANYRTPVKRLFLCGSAAHPGGGVMGAPGMNAAREMLKAR